MSSAASKLTPQLIEDAKNGSKQALEDIVQHIQDDVYKLAMKMLWHPQDAEDATQEILIRIITHLSSFRGDSAFKTWMYRVASNYLLTTRKRRAEQSELTFAAFGEDLYAGLSDTIKTTHISAEQNLLVEEVKTGCTQGMLLCLDRDHRITYILGDILKVSSEQGGLVLDITPTAFRKRLSRARKSIRDFMQQKCGLVNKSNGCRCKKRVDQAVKLGRVNPDHLLFANHPVRTVRKEVAEIEALEQTAGTLHAHPDYAAPDALLKGIKSLVTSGKFSVFR